MKAALAFLVFLTTSSTTSSVSVRPQEYSLANCLRPCSSGKGNSIAWSIRPGREAKPVSKCSGRFVVSTKRTAASSRRPSISFRSLFRRLSSHGPYISSRLRAIRSTSSITNHGWLKESRKLEIVIEVGHFLRGYQQGRMIWELAGQIVGGVGLARARRAVEQQSFLIGRPSIWSCSRCSMNPRTFRSRRPRVFSGSTTSSRRTVRSL